MPDGVSTILGGGFPRRGLIVRVLVTMPPSFFKSISDSNSLAYPNVPDATSTGFLSFSLPILISKFIPIGYPSPEKQAPPYKQLHSDSSLDPSSRLGRLSSEWIRSV